MHSLGVGRYGFVPFFKGAFKYFDRLRGLPLLLPSRIAYHCDVAMSLVLCSLVYAVFRCFHFLSKEAVT